MTSAMMPGYGNQLMYSSYFAPRGRNRMYALGQQLSERYLSPLDRLIGIIGDAGAGKSSLVKGMFPGLELTNDDDGVNIRPLPLLKNIDRGFFQAIPIMWISGLNWRLRKYTNWLKLLPWR